MGMSGYKKGLMYREDVLVGSVGLRHGIAGRMELGVYVALHQTYLES